MYESSGKNNYCYLIFLLGQKWKEHSLILKAKNPERILVLISVALDKLPSPLKLKIFSIKIWTVYF